MKLTAIIPPPERQIKITHHRGCPIDTFHRATGELAFYVKIPGTDKFTYCDSMQESKAWIEVAA